MGQGGGGKHLYEEETAICPMASSPPSFLTLEMTSYLKPLMACYSHHDELPILSEDAPHITDFVTEISN